MTQLSLSGGEVVRVLEVLSREPDALNIAVFVSILSQMPEYCLNAAVFPFFELCKSLFTNYKIIPRPMQFQLPKSSLTL